MPIHRNFLALTFLFFISGIAYGQTSTPAERAWSNKRYQDAAELFLLEYNADHSDINAISKLAECHRLLKNFEEAEGWYDLKFASTPPTAEEALAYAQVLASNKKYASSREWYRKFGDLKPEDPRADMFDTAYANIKQFFKDSARWEIYYLAINTNADEYAPMILDSGLYFTTNRIKDSFFKTVSTMSREPFTDIYMVPDRYDILQIKEFETSDTTEVSRKHDTEKKVFAGSDNTPFATFNNRFIETDNTVFDEAKEVIRVGKEVNGKMHDGNCTYSPKTRMMFYNTTQVATGDTTKTAGAFYDYQKLKLVFQYYNNGDWGKQQNFQFNSKTYTTAHPALSADGNVLYFISDMPGGFGGMDVYYCLKTDGYWGEPVNMGPMVNTVSNEVSPYIFGNRLYFSTIGWPGLGGLDVFYTEIVNNEASTPAKNLGFPLNSSSDDFGLIYEPNGKNGYFSSNRRGNDDIYRFGKP